MERPQVFDHRPSRHGRTYDTHRQPVRTAQHGSGLRLPAAAAHAVSHFPHAFEPRQDMRERRLRHVLRENRRVAGDAPPILPEALRNKVLYRARRMRHKAKLWKPLEHFIRKRGRVPAGHGNVRVRERFKHIFRRNSIRKLRKRVEIRKGSQKVHGLL